MPQVKYDYIVSFSNEDSNNPASNLLAAQLSKKKWLCSAGEPSCSVVLQLTRAVKISSVHIGAYHTALIEVLVGRSEKPNDEYQVLVPSSVYLSPLESRRETDVERVRTFSGEQLAPARDHRWDRLRVVCSQPYNKHCKYGLSFIHVFEPENKDVSTVPRSSEAAMEPAALPASAVPPRVSSLTLETFSSDEDDFSPGELFAKHLQSHLNDTSGQSSTDTQIRQATSHAFKKIPDSRTQLIKTPIRNINKTQYDSKGDQSNRSKDNLLYTDDDNKPHPKIDQVVQRHKDEIAKRTDYKNRTKVEINNKTGNSNTRIYQAGQDNQERRSKEEMYNINTTTKDRDQPSTSEKNKRKRTRSDNTRAGTLTGLRAGTGTETVTGLRPGTGTGTVTGLRPGTGTETVTGLRAGPVSLAPHTLLRGVVFALSGYENPRRARVRDSALAMGASFQRDYTAQCTHLICAFPNTPKLKQVRASGAACTVVTADWVELCCKHTRLLPWQWFATEPDKRVLYTEYDLKIGDENIQPESENDTDDEIEKVLQQQKKQRTHSPSTLTAITSEDYKRPDRSEESDITFIRDERIQGNVTIEDSDTDATVYRDLDQAIKTNKEKPLPDFFDGFTFYIDKGVEKMGFDSNLLCRYVRAYGGEIIEQSQLDQDTELSYILCGDEPNDSTSGVCVRADWVWRCHNKHRLCDTDAYLL